MHKILSIDVGEKRIGLATSDELGIIASPFGFISRDGSVDKISEIVLQENIGQIVVGMPYLPSGDMGSQAEDVHKYISELQSKISVKIDTENEILTSVEANNRLKSMHRKIKDKGEVDAMAATIILEGYLNRRKS